MSDFKRIKKAIEAGPRIEYKSGGEWKELYGHACSTIEEAEAYCKRFGGSMRVMQSDRKIASFNKDLTDPS